MGSKKVTENDIIELVKENNYIYYQSEKRENKKGRKDVWIKISCGKHEPYWCRFHHFKRGTRCKQCFIEELTKWNEKNITEYILSQNYNIICFESEILGNKTKIKVQCDKKHESYITNFANFYAGKRCSECYGNKKFTFTYVKKEIEKDGLYTFLSNEYINNANYLKVKCIKHNYIFNITFADWQSGTRCKLCANEKLSQDRRKDFSKVKYDIENSGQFKLLSNEEDYINNMSTLKIKCTSCNNTFDDTYAHFIKRNNCKICESQFKFTYYSNEELINILFQLKEKLNHIPYVRDMKSENSVPSATVYFTRFNTTSWIEILKIAGLKIEITDEYLRNEFLRWIEEYKHIPYKGDMRHEDGYPNTRDYCDFYLKGDMKWLGILNIMNVTRPQILGKRRTYKYDDYNMEDCIDIVKHVYKDNSKATILDIQKFICPRKVLKELDCLKWADVLRICEITEFGNERYYDKDEALKRLYNYIIKLNYIPSTYQWNKDVGRPYSSYYAKIFGTWENAISVSGINIKEMMKQYLVDLYTSTKQSPTRKQLTIKKGSQYGSQKYLIVFNVDSWNDVLKECGIPINWQSYTDEEILIILRKIYNEYGKVLTTNEFINSNISIHYTLLGERFGSYYNAWYMAGLAEKPLNDEERIEASLFELKQLSEQLGRVPTTSEYDNNLKRGFNRHTLSEKLNGTFSKICFDNLNYTYNTNVVYGRLYFDKMGNLCRSIVELTMSNFFFDNNIKFEKEIKYNDFCDKMSRYIADYKVYDKVNNMWYYVEYFGMYSLYSSSNKHVKKYTIKTKKKIKFLNKNYEIDKCIFIFPSTLKVKTLEEIFNKFL